MPLPHRNMAGDYTAESDEALVLSCKSGNTKAFDELMRRYVEPIYNFARQYVKTSEDAEDITQDSFYKAWKNVSAFTEGKTFRPWLYTIARNTALDYIKKKHIAAFSHMDDEDSELTYAETIVDTELMPHEVFERMQTRAELDRLMEGLHPDHRAVLLMHYDQEMTFEEIAETIGKPMNTVKSWHRRALVRMRDNILHQGRAFDRNH